MSLLVVHWDRRRRPHAGYSTVCVLFNGGCWHNLGRDYLKWCHGCRRMRNERIKGKRKITKNSRV